MNRRDFIKGLAAVAIVGPAAKLTAAEIEPPIAPFIHQGNEYSINPEWVNAPYELGFKGSGGIEYVGFWPPRFADLRSAKYWFEFAAKASKPQAVTLYNRFDKWMYQ